MSGCVTTLTYLIIISNLPAGIEKVSVDVKQPLPNACIYYRIITCARPSIIESPLDPQSVFEA